MRAAGCVVNDLFDRDIDRQVVRTRNRPLASGEVTVLQALFFLSVLCLIGLAVLLRLPVICWILGIVAAGLALAYPLAKRYISFPQLILGGTFNMGVLVGAAAVSPQWLEPVTIWLYLAAILWTIAYDTIYALQDIVDDKKLRVGSTAVLFGRHVIPLVGLSYGVMHVLLGVVLFQMDSGPIGYILLLSSLIYVVVKLRLLNQDDLEACRQFFIANQMVGAFVFLALMLR